MLKRVTFSFFAVLLVVSLSFAGNSKTEVHSKASIAIEQNAELGVKSTTPDKAQVGNALLIGKMWNAYTTQASYTNQLYFDPFSNLMGVVKRNDRTGAGSGRIVYQVSDDMGQNWTGQIGPLNEPNGYTLGRHPNLVLSNPSKSSDISQVTMVASWPELAASWYYYAFAGDPVGAGSPFFMDDSVYYPGDEMFVGDNGDAFAVVPLIETDYVNDGTGDVNQQLFRSQDGGQTWATMSLSYTTDFYDDTFNGTKSDIAANGKGYIVAEAQDPNLVDTYSFAWKSTSDDGETWDADWTWVDYWSIPFDGGTLGDQVNALNFEVDAITYTPMGSENTSLFFVGTFVDTVDGTNTGIFVLDNQTGAWRATKMASVNTTTQDLPGGLSTLNEVEFARSNDGSVLAVKWADLPSESATGYDLFVSWYDGESWTTPENYTETADINEVYSQTAPRLYNVSGDEWQLLSMYTVFGADDLAEAELWFVDGVTATVVPVAQSVEDDNELAYTFELQQNYPNPFNPSTTIKYSVPQLTDVSVKVYDVLGKEIATLVNTQQAQGVYEVNFDASDLASGMYIYTIKAGSFTSSKKMLLMK